MNRAEWERSQLPCPEDFGWWFSGLVDGEGCFHISPTAKGGFVCGFTLKLRADDWAMLEQIRGGLGLGRIYLGEHALENGRPWAAWKIAKKNELVRLTEILDVFRLRSKKGRDYAIWRKAVIHWANSDRPIDWWPVEQAYTDLRSVREYAPDYGTVNVPETPSTDEEIAKLPVLDLDKLKLPAKRHGNRLGFPSDRRRHGS